MKKRQRTTTKVGLILLIFAVSAVAFLPLQTWAADCVDPADCDLDGILNAYEGECLPLSSQCSVTNPTTNLNSADLFVILARPTESILNQFNFDPLAFIKGTYVPLTFGMTLHEISLAEVTNQGVIDLKVTPEQKAVVLIEDLDPNDGDLGTSPIGVPTQGRVGSMFTNRIRDDIVKGCSSLPCEAVNSDGVPKASGIDKIFQFYAQNVVAHEIFHMVNRVVPAINSDNHYPQEGYIMDNHMYFKAYKKTKTAPAKIVWTITDKWKFEDKPQYK